MKKILGLAFTFIFCGSPLISPAHATTEENKPTCKQSDLKLETGSKDGTTRKMVGQTLHIVAKGGCIAVIKEQVEKKPTDPDLTLVLDNIVMNGIKPTRPQTSADNELIVPFELNRDSLADANRKSWDELLFKQRGGYTMKMPVALIIGNDPAVQAASREQFELQIREPSRVAFSLIGSLVAFIAAFIFTVRNTNALRDSEGGAFSLGKSQMAFWGLLVIFSFLGVFLVTETMERVPPEVLIMLGISSSTGLGALLIGSGKKSLQEHRAELEAGRATTGTLSVSDTIALERLNQEIIKAQETKARNEKLVQSSRWPMTLRFLADICDDGNGTSFHRMQVVLWTVVLGGIFIWSVAKTMSMPTFQDTLLLLMGISNGAYLSFKVPEKT